MNRKQKILLIRILSSAAIVILLGFVKPTGYARFGLYMIPYLIVGYDILKKAAVGIYNRQVFDENFLMAVATIGALILAVTDTGDYVEAVAVMLFYQTGELFQSCAVGKSRRSISQLMDIRPDHANVEIDGRLVQLDPEDVTVGTTIVVQPGEKIPIDGVVCRGSSDLNTGALTGESVPTYVQPGDGVISGCVNMTGVLEIRTTREFGESTVSKILDLVENASSCKSRSEKFISKFARIYTPAVCFSALALVLLPPVACLALGMAPEWGKWIYRGLTFLVISCPCALVISIPLGFFAGIGGAGNAGILIKGSNYLETLARADIFVFDKTGTLTRGRFEVQEVHGTHMDNNRLLEYVALAESSSSHPIGRCIIDAYGKAPDRSRVTDIVEVGGHGIIAKVDGISVAVGNARLMEEQGICLDDCQLTGTVVHACIDGKYAGHITVADTVKTGSCAAVEQLRVARARVVMLTGDRKEVAESVSQSLGIEETYSQLLPENKVEIVEKLIEEKTDRSILAFIGDGINDAPALSRADIGIAMGAMGSDAAIEAADVVLMDDDPLKIIKAVKISKKCMGIVYQNIVFAIGVKLICLVLGAFGLTNMWIAIFADVGVMIIAVLNAIRALFVNNL